MLDVCDGGASTYGSTTPITAEVCDVEGNCVETSITGNFLVFFFFYISTLGSTKYQIKRFFQLN